MDDESRALAPLTPDQVERRDAMANVREAIEALDSQLREARTRLSEAMWECPHDAGREREWDGASWVYPCRICGKV